ncbi:ricin-type beta-trefoil lectin domain protein [Streptomyces sp. DSM 15324]|uniref:ricin-type beta-trefoil lectin domain protein n=1 Tax=Streptomyces sp. DSM 15324 TaxID=1739111 RepID=UPI00074825DC|nr:ricin-type beta-trefoil lectin domain protein [Streptomyces sp. DSM 15324]KUO09055.1 hydrolase [Streptomyces sp. DSM 15324]
MNDAGLSNSPSARRLDATDEQLSAELTQSAGESPALHPVGELLDRHWEAAFAYARLCTDGERAAGMLTTAAFTRLFGATQHQDGPTAAWRPHLLATVRRLAGEWDADGRRDLLHPALRHQDAEGTPAAALLLPPANRRMIARAFHRLPQSARCLLWHCEAEAEPLAIPAQLLGLDEEGAHVELRRSRERLREEVLQVHREQATDDECHRYHRLLDVTCRRGGLDVDPDLRGHTEQCRHCAHTADQLLQFEGLLGVALAEGILGWAAGAYLEGRTADGRERTAAPARERHPGAVGEAFDGEPAAPRRPDAASGARGGAEASRPAAGPGSGTEVALRPASRRSDRKAARRIRRRNLTAAVLTVSGMVVLPLVAWAALGSDGGSGATAGAGTKTPSAGTDTATDSPSWIADQETQGTLRGRLHNVASGLCIGIAGGKAAKGADTELAACSSDAGQQWTYETDGLLRSAADPNLCLDSHLGYSVRLGECADSSAGTAKSVRYDFTLQGTLVPRSDQNLALAPAATDGSGALVLKNRANGTAQRWVIDTSQPDPQMEFVNWGADETGTAGSTPKPTPTPKAATPKSADPAPSATPTTKSSPGTTTSGGSTPGTSCSYSSWYYCNWSGKEGGPGYGGWGNGGSGYGGGGYGGGGYGGGYGSGYGHGGDGRH